MTPDYLRFDFPFDRALTADELRAIEDEVRRIIREDRPVSIEYMTMAEAVEGGADAFFDEKYGETVRTIRVEDYSFELCGGTHCRATGQIGRLRDHRRAEHRLRDAPHRGADRRSGRCAGSASASPRWSVRRRRPAPRTAEALPDRIAALQDELRETRRRLREGGGAAVPRPARARGIAPRRSRPGVRLVAAPPRTTRSRPSRARQATSAACSGPGSSRSGSTPTSPRSSSPSATTSSRAASPPATSSASPWPGWTGGAAAGRRWPRERERAARGWRRRLEAIRDAVRTNGATGG